MEIVVSQVEDNIVICERCGYPEYLGEMSLLYGNKVACRKCYSEYYGVKCTSDRRVPSRIEYDVQEEIKKRET